MVKRYNWLTMKTQPKLILFVSLIFACLLIPSQVVSAQAGSATDMVNAVNNLRAQNGLPAYEFDAGLMASAQQHADYMASIKTVTHTRADGSTPSDLGFIENIAAGNDLSVLTTIYSFWTDSAHWSTMVGISAGYAGAGVSIVDGYVYYALNVRRASSGSYIAPPTSSASSVSAAAVQTTPQPVVMPVITSTPMPDGSVIHEVQSGQALWSIAIAYGAKIADIIGLNQLAATPIIYEGDRLIIFPSSTPTLTPTITQTPVPATRTPSLTPTPKTPTLTPSITPTPTATPHVFISLDNLKNVDRKTIGIAMIAICALGLIFVVISSLKK